MRFPIFPLRLAALACLILSPVGAALAQDRIYRCAGSGGKVVFQAQPCADTMPKAGADLPAPQSQPQPKTRPQPAPAPAQAQAQPAFSVSGPGFSFSSPTAPRPAATASQPAAAPAPPASKQWGKEADVMVVSGYQTSGLVEVNVTHTSRPVLLVLTSYSGARWKVLASPGTRIKAIVVSSSEGTDRGNVQAPADVPVVVDTLPYSYETANIKFRELMGKLNARYGVERVLGFRGAYQLPQMVLLAAPFVADPTLTMKGVLPETPAVRFSFALASVDGRRLPFTNTGPKDGGRYNGIVRGGTLSAPRAGPAALGEDGRAAFYFEGNGGTLLWAPNGVSGPKEKVEFPANMPPLSWGAGLAWDTRRGVLGLVSFGGEGYFYRYDTRKRRWLDFHSLQNRDLISLSLNPDNGDFLAISDKNELVRFNSRGELEDVQPLDKLLTDLDSTYDKGNGSSKGLTAVAGGPAMAIVNVREGTVTHIWTYEPRARKAQLTYKLFE